MFYKQLWFFFVLVLSVMMLNACDAKAPKLMKATQQFESDEKRDQHIAYMRSHHMHALKHKRDKTMYQGIRTEEHSLNACINCHVPETYNDKVLRDTDPEHFCTTCHTYVAEKLNCFECHVDHPVTETADKAIESNPIQTNIIKSQATVKDLSKLTKQELMDLAFKYSKEVQKRGGVSSQSQQPTKPVNGGANE